MPGQLESVLGKIPGLAGYLGGQQADQEQQIGQLQQVGALQGIMAQIEAQKLAPLKAEMLKAQVAKAQQEQQMNQKLMGGGLGNMTPDQLDALGQKLAMGGHPGAATVMGIADKRRAAEAQKGALLSMQSRPGTPDAQPLTPNDDEGNPMPAVAGTPAQAGVADFLKDSKYVGTAAKNLQMLIDRGAPGMTPQMIQQHLDRLTQMHTTQSGMDNRQDKSQVNKIEIRTMFPPASTIDATTPQPALTPEAEKVKNDLIRNGLPVPKTRRGQIDNEALNSIGRENAAKGDSAIPISANRADYKSKQAALTQNSKDLTAIRPYNDMLHMNGDIAIELAQKAIATDSKLANKPINWLRQNAGDNPDVAEFLAQVQIVSTESARVLNNPRLVGQLTDSARHEMQGIVNGDMPLNSLTRVIRRMQSDGNNRVSAMVKERNDLRRSLGGSSDPEATTPAPASGAPARVRKYNPTTGALE